MHKFHDGEAREIYNLFSDRRNSRLAMLTAYSVANGLVDQKAVPPEVFPHIKVLLHFYLEDLDAEDDDDDEDDEDEEDEDADEE
jgi:hypothetical protein